jgi:hypothetical protein
LLTNCQSQYEAHQEELGDGVGSLDFASNERDQAAIIDGHQRGASVLLAFNKAWHKASEAKSK